MHARRRRLLPVLLALLAPAAGLAARPGGDPTYAALRAARPDGRTVAVHGLILERDAFRFELASGTLHLLAPVAGQTVGAVFLGDGGYRLTPGSETERRHLALAAGGGERLEVLADRFDTLILLFTDGTAEEIARHAPAVSGAPDPRATAAYEAYLARQRHGFATNFHLRLLRDLLGRPDRADGVFLAFVEGKRYPPALAAFDPDGAEGLAIAQMMGGDTTLLYLPDPERGGVWYSSPRRADAAAGRVPPAVALADAERYRIETEVAKSGEISGRTAIEMKILAPGLRVLPLHLDPRLRIESASFTPAPPAPPTLDELAVVQEAAREDADPAVVFPRPLAAGEAIEVRLAYRGGGVLHDAGDKNFVVGARESWYPNLGTFSDPAAFELTYRVPAGDEIVSVGRRVEARTEGESSLSTWRTDGPVRVAGFNYGRFKKLARRDEPSGIEVAVYTNPGTPDALRAINAALADAPQAGGIGAFDADSLALPTMSESLGRVDTSRLAESALVDGLNAARLFTAYFGPLGVGEVAITQQSQWSFGQSWPSLIFLPYLSFLDGTRRRQLGLAAAKDFVDAVGFHEFAHQWWGHRVGWSSYRDLWLSEGFAEFSAGLALEHTQGRGAYDRFFRDRRRQILDRTPGGPAGYEAGPIALGSRLDTQRSPGAVPAVVYAKGAYVLHMLRMLMWDGGARAPDAPFIAMMRDYAATYAGKSPSTADFQRVVERHMVPAMNATGDGRMDWFFDQWVYGTEIPRYAADLKVEPQGEGYRVSGRVAQEGVGPRFRALVPLYVELGKGELARVAVLPMVGETARPVDLVVKLPRKPRRALVNARGEVLARD